MARLPGVIDVGAARGARLSGNGVNPTDFGLGDLGQGLEAVGQAMGQRDDQDAEKIIRSSQGAFETRFGEMAAGYDGRESGFANKALASFRNHFTAVSEDPTYSGGVRAALRRRLDGYEADLGRRAISVETEKRAGIVVEQARVKQEVAASGALIGFNGDFSARYQARVDAYDGRDPDFATGVLSDYDASAQAAVDAAPEALKPVLQARLAARRVQTHAGALETQDKAHGAFVAEAAKAGLNALSNTVLSNPAGYDTALPDLDGVAAGIPAALRPAFLKEARGALVAARLEGLILKGDHAQAKTELDDGRYDAVLKPNEKEALLARTQAAARAGDDPADWRQRLDDNDAIDGEVAARLRGATTGLSLQAMADRLSGRDMAQTERRLIEADRAFLATGNLKGADGSTLRARASAPSPDPAAFTGRSGAYAEALTSWEAGRKAAADELAVREKDPAAWAMASEKAGDAGAELQRRQAAWFAAEAPADQVKTGAAYAARMLGEQQHVGIPAASQRVLAKAQAATLVAGYTSAPPEQRGRALETLGQVWKSLPERVILQDGRAVNPRVMAARELGAAGLGGPDVSALVDLTDEPGKLRLYAEAAANPQARAALTEKGKEATLASAIDARLTPFLATANALPGSPEQNVARVSRVRLVARHLMLTQGLTAREAAEKASADLVDSYRFVDTWRVPRAIADAPASLPAQVSGPTLPSRRGTTIRRGAALVLADLIGDDGARLSPAEGRPGMTIEARQISAADTVEKRGRWVTTEGDTGLTLLVPTARGWTPKTDVAGRAITLTWAQLAKEGETAGNQRKPGGWMAPSPTAAASGKVAPAQARKALTAALEWQESRGRTDAVSPKGALGPRQLMIPTARGQAKADGLRVFDGKSDEDVRAMLLADPGLNRKLSDNHIEALARSYDGHVPLMLAAYNAGGPAVDGWLRRIGDPRKGRISVDQWVAAIPYPETRDYVRKVLPRAMAELERRG